MLSRFRVLLLLVMVISLTSCISIEEHEDPVEQWIVVENFDDLVEGTINQQDGWVDTYENCIIQSAKAFGGAGKALQLALPADVGKVFSETGKDGVVTIGLSLLLEDPLAKVVVRAYDPEGKSIMMFFHDERDYWGIQYQGQTWKTVSAGITPEVWIDLVIRLDFSSKQFTVEVDTGSGFTTLWSGMGFIDDESTGFARLALIRYEGQGDPSPIYVDNIEIRQD